MNKTKIWAFGISIVMVLMLTTVLGMAHTVDDPYTTRLVAGRTIDVGNVTVSNNGTHLFVEYNTTGGWVLSETHLAVVVNVR